MVLKFFQVNIWELLGALRADYGNLSILDMGIDTIDIVLVDPVRILVVVWINLYFLLLKTI